MTWSQRWHCDRQGVSEVVYGSSGVHPAASMAATASSRMTRLPEQYVQK